MSPESTAAEGIGTRARSWLRRGFHVAAVFWRYGFGPALHSLGLGRFVPRRRDRQLEAASEDLSLPVRLRLACEEIGPVTIKLAQVLGARPDLIPEEYASEFRHLQDRVPPVPFDDVRQLAEAELGMPLEEAFGEFDEEPVAAASIGQVHFAKLRDGRHVAVKVQRPDVAQTVETDLQILSFAAREAERHVPVLKEHRISEWADEFAYGLREELDYIHEARNTDRLRNALADAARITAPRVHWDLTTRRVLVLERIEGVRIDDLDGLREFGVDPSELASRLATCILRQVYVEGYFHADPHAGNLFVGRSGRITFLDSGNAGSIGRDMREAMARILLAVLDEDTVEICDQITELGAPGESTNLQNLRRDVAQIIGRYSGAKTSEISIGDGLEAIMQVAFRHHVRMPATFASVLRAFILTDGICRHLAPEFDFREVGRDIIRQVLHEWLRPSNVIREVWRFARDVQRFTTLIPRQFSELLGRAQSAGLRVRIEERDFDGTLRRLDSMVNRVAFALVVAAIIVGSSVMIASQRATSLLASPWAGAYGIIGAAMGLFLLYSILRSGRL